VVGEPFCKYDIESVERIDRVKSEGVVPLHDLSIECGRKEPKMDLNSWV